MVFRAGIGIYFDQTQMNETQFITNGPPIFTQQNINLTGRGLPEYEFGKNTLPVVTIPPIDANYITPKGTNLFAAEIDGRKPRVYMWTFSMQKSSGATGWRKRPMSARMAAVSLRGITLMPMSLLEFCTTSRPGLPRAIRNLNQMLYSSNAGWSEFHALNLKLEKRFSSGFQILMAHTFAKSIDTDSAGSYGSPT